MIREIVQFDLYLGTQSDEFMVAFRAVQDALAGAGVVKGRVWSPMTGVGRTIIWEREFNSLSDYELDEQRFHEAKDIMQLWRKMEALTSAMRVELWQGSSRPE